MDATIRDTKTSKHQTYLSAFDRVLMVVAKAILYLAARRNVFEKVNAGMEDMGMFDPPISDDHHTYL